jgi:glycine oxidase ThiO
MPVPDVVVVGGGIIGCACAHELAARGARVRLVDPRGVARGATYASAGLLAPYTEGHSSSVLRELGRRSLAMYDEFVARVSDASGASMPYERCGTLEVAYQDPAVEALRASARRNPAECSFLDAAAVRELEPQLAPDVAGGVLVASHGYVGAEALARALWLAAEARGATLDPASVTEIRGASGGITVETSRGSIAAGSVVAAAGCWSSGIGVPGTSPLPVRPVRGQLLRLRWAGPPLTRVLWGPACYLVPWRDGSLLVGATSEDAGFDEGATVAGVRGLLEAACDLVPRTWGAGFDEVRVGLRPAGPDEAPIVGPSARVPNLVYATAHYRNGILLAPLTAAIVADLVVDGRADPAISSTTPARFDI